jgi:hypothetical protein
MPTVKPEIAVGIDGELVARELVPDECPICAGNRDPATGGLRYNAVTLAAMQEARDMASGKIPGKWYHSLEEALEDN